MVGDGAAVAGRAIASAAVEMLPSNTCNGGSGSTVAKEAFALAFKNALVFIDWDRSEAARRTYGCLYGFETNAVTQATYPRVPWGVSILSIAQNILSAILIFLFLLAVRNLLKLK